MKQLVKICFTGLVISFLGSLPLGTLNVTATNIAVNNGMPTAFLFSIGSVLVEMIYVRAAMSGMNWIYSQYRLFRLFQWATFLMLVLLASSSFYAAIYRTGFAGALPFPEISPFLLGMFLSAINPLHIIFWFGWSTILLNRGILLPQSKYYNIYVAGIGVGSLMGFGVFIVGGNYLVNTLRANQDVMNWAIGAALFITACIQLYKILKRPLSQPVMPQI